MFQKINIRDIVLWRENATKSIQNSPKRHLFSPFRVHFLQKPYYFLHFFTFFKQKPPPKSRPSCQKPPPKTPPIFDFFDVFTNFCWRLFKSAEDTVIIRIASSDKQVLL